MVRSKKGSGQKIGQSAKPEQKVWLPSNFRLEISGLDCKFVTKIDSFTVKQTFASGIGVGRDFEVQFGKLEFPNLSITLSEAHAQSWIDWHNDFVIMGKNSEENEKSGSLIFLSPDLSTELGRVNFHNLGIFRLSFDPAEADQINSVTAGCTATAWSFSPASSPARTSAGSAGGSHLIRRNGLSGPTARTPFFNLVADHEICPQRTTVRFACLVPAEAAHIEPEAFAKSPEM